jgi:heme exporter protein A
MQGADTAARIAAHDLACRRGDRLLFRSVTFVLKPGEALQVSGANGVGKSSLLRLIAGLARPFSGKVERAGTIGLVDERPALDPELPLDRALAFWSRLDRSKPAGLERLGLADLLDVPVRYLSTGQRKRAAMARLLGQDAAVWLLDEPLNGLDVQAAGLIEELTAAHCASGGIAVIASHQPFALAGMRALALADYAG